jgi:hypothetical protein
MIFPFLFLYAKIEDFNAIFVKNIDNINKVC